MNEGSPYGWLFFAALGLGLFLSSLFRKQRSRFWLMAGASLFLIALGGAFIFTNFIVTGFIRNRVLPFYLPVTLFFFIATWRLAVLPPALILLFSLIPIVWGTSGVYSLEEGVYPVKITCYPGTAAGRSYNILFQDGRESSLTGCGDYLVVERISWDWRLFFMTAREIPVGFSPAPGEEDLQISSEEWIPLSLERDRISERPGMRRDRVLIGPLGDELFYTWWLVRNYRGELMITSQNPLSRP